MTLYKRISEKELNGEEGFYIVINIVKSWAIHTEKELMLQKKPSHEKYSGTPVPNSS